MNSTISVDYGTQHLIVDQTTFEKDFEILENRRKIRSGQVRKLLASLQDGHGFPPIALNKRGKKLRVLDGNHRYEALKHYFAKNPDAKVELVATIYKIEDDEEERAKFRELNAGLRPNSDDILQQYAKKHPFLISLTQAIPIVSVYGSASCPLKIRVLLSAYLNAVKDTPSQYVYGSEELLDALNELDGEDIELMQEFLTDYQEVYGVLQKNTVWIRTTIFNAIFRIWYQNLDRLTDSQMHRKMSLLINHPTVIELSKIGGAQASFSAIIQFTAIMNNTGRNYNLVYAP